MKNDRPTSLRRGHGFHEARAAGAPFVSPRSGYAMQRDLKERHSQKILNDLVKREPTIEALVAETMRVMKTGWLQLPNGHLWQIPPEHCFSAHLLCYFVLFCQPKLAPPGYWQDMAKYGYDAPLEPS